MKIASATKAVGALTKISPRKVVTGHLMNPILTF